MTSSHKSGVRPPIGGARTQKGEMAKACGFPVDLTVYIAVRLKI